MSFLFEYHLPDDARNYLVTLDAMGELKVDPPINEQCYIMTNSILEDPRWSSHFKKIADFGCGAMHFFKLLRRLEAVEHIIEVDIDESILLMHYSQVAPLISDNFKPRNRPLRVEVFKGNITDTDNNLRDIDAVLVLEVIENLMADQLEKLAENIFGFIQPKLVIISTANRDFNVILNSGLNANGLRQNVHKFEWTRKECKEWATNICKKYKNYAFTIKGVGKLPLDYKKIGPIMQLVIFARNDLIERQLLQPIRKDLQADNSPEKQYKIIYATDFSFQVDTRTKEQKIKDEINGYIERTHTVDRYYNHERHIYQIPIKGLIDCLQTINATEQDVVKVLKELKFVVENEFIILTDDYIDEHFRCRGDDFYEECDDDFLNFESYRPENDEGIDNDLSSTSSIQNKQQDDEEECWD